MQHFRSSPSPLRDVMHHWLTGELIFSVWPLLGGWHKYKYAQANTIFKLLATQLRPISPTAVQPLLIASVKEKEKKQGGGARLPRSPIKISFGKVAPFHPSFFSTCSSPTTAMVQLQNGKKATAKADYWKTKSNAREGERKGRNEKTSRAKKMESARKAISHALDRKLGNNFKC